jgi:hypothetical protein
MARNESLPTAARADSSFATRVASPFAVRWIHDGALQLEIGAARVPRKIAGPKRTTVWSWPSLVTSRLRAAPVKPGPSWSCRARAPRARDLVALCGEVHVGPRLCGVRKPRKKGEIERAIRCLRGRFLAARAIRDINRSATSFSRDG